jgi:nitrous oxidase accessory protein
MQIRVFLFFFLLTFKIWANSVWVGRLGVKTITEALSKAQAFDTVYVPFGIYKEGNLLVNKPVCLLGVNKPILDGQKKFEVLSIRSNDVKVSGFKVQHSGFGTLEDPGAIKLYNAYRVEVSNNELEDNFFGIYIQNGKNCVVKNNIIKAYGTEEQQIGNGIHCWKSDSLQLIGNKISGHRDGIYFEFVTHSIIWRNISKNNIRYGLHFMFSNNDAYIGN